MSTVTSVSQLSSATSRGKLSTRPEAQIVDDVVRQQTAAATAYKAFSRGTLSRGDVGPLIALTKRIAKVVGV